MVRLEAAVGSQPARLWTVEAAGGMAADVRPVIPADGLNYFHANLFRRQPRLLDSAFDRSGSLQLWV